MPEDASAEVDLRGVEERELVDPQPEDLEQREDRGVSCRGRRIHRRPVHRTDVDRHRDCRLGSALTLHSDPRGRIGHDALGDGEAEERAQRHQLGAFRRCAAGRSFPPRSCEEVLDVGAGGVALGEQLEERRD